MSEQQKMCAQKIFDGMSFRGRHCSRCATKSYTNDAGTVLWYCGTHHPDAARERREKANRKHEAQWAQRTATLKAAKIRQDALEACKTAIENIAAGHNDPRALAAETLKLFPQ